MTEPVAHEARASIGRSGKTPERLVIIGLVLLVILIAKPWGAPPEQAAAPGPTASIGPTPAPRGTGDVPCTGRTWLVEADTRWSGERVRSWILTDAVQAGGPAGPIGFVVVAAEQVLAIGYCPPSFDDPRPNDVVTIYRLGPTISTVVTTPVSVAGDADAARNQLFAPVATPGAAGQSPTATTWAAGRYAIRIDGAAGYQRWLGVEIRLISPGAGSPAPTPGASSGA